MIRAYDIGALEFSVREGESLVGALVTEGVDVAFHVREDDGCRACHHTLEHSDRNVTVCGDTHPVSHGSALMRELVLDHAGYLLYHATQRKLGQHLTQEAQHD